MADSEIPMRPEVSSGDDSPPLKKAKEDSDAESDTASEGADDDSNTHPGDADSEADTDSEGPDAESDTVSDKDSDTDSEDADAEADADSDQDSDAESDPLVHGGRRFLLPDIEDEEYQRQYELFHYQFERSQGFVIDWDKFDYLFSISRVAWAPRLGSQKTNDELINDLTLYAIKEHNQKTEEDLEFVEHVEANFMVCQGCLFWITFRARHMSSSSPESSLYQTKVWQFRDEIEVCLFRPRPTDEGPRLHFYWRCSDASFDFVPSVFLAL